jgi:hypothetical protein
MMSASKEQLQLIFSFVINIGQLQYDLQPSRDMAQTKETEKSIK